MSAYSGEKPTIVNLYGAQHGAESLAEFGAEADRGETDSFVTLARHITSALATERAQAQKLRRELAELKAGYSKALADMEAKLKESSSRAERLQKDLERSVRSEQDLQAQLRTHADYITRFRAHYDDVKASWKDWQHKIVLELQVAKSSLEHIRQRNAVLEAENTVGKKELEKTGFELQRHKAALTEAWNAERRANALLGEHERLKMVAKDLETSVARERGEKQANANYAKEVYAKLLDLRRKYEELHSSFEPERKLRSFAEDSLKKERRDKQIALDYLKQAETRISELERELAGFR